MRRRDFITRRRRGDMSDCGGRAAGGQATDYRVLGPEHPFG
jgi:hypothetical protein